MSLPSIPAEMMIAPSAALGINAPPIHPNRLKAFQRRSLFRGGRSLIGVSGVRTSIGAGATVPVAFTIAEAGILGVLVVDTDAPDAELSITSIKHNNDELLTGLNTPVSMFLRDSVYNPRVLRWVDVSDQLQVTFLNNGAAAAIVIPGFTAA